VEYFKCESGVLNQGDALQEVKKLPDKSVNCVITSPPYWQLRDYGFPEQWGLEPTFEEFLEHLWSLMDEIWRVLRDDGTVFINLGDTYSTQSGSMGINRWVDPKNPIATNTAFRQTPVINIKDKCLLLIPHRFGIGCIDRGWIMRNDIIWAKRNGMPESCRDRFSKKHEYFFFMVKSQKYYFDLDGIKTPYAGNLDRWGGNMVRGDYNSKTKQFAIGERAGRNMRPDPNGKNPGSVSDFWDIPTKPSKKKHYATFNTQLIDKPIIAGCPEGGIILDPFNGTGTTTLRAEQLRRKWIGIDGSEESCEMAKEGIEHEREQLKMDF